MASGHFASFQNFCNFILVKYTENIEDFIECILEKKAIDFGKSKHYKGEWEHFDWGCWKRRTNFGIESN